MRYRAIVFHPGARTLWVTGRIFEGPQTFPIPILEGQKPPDPAEVIMERRFPLASFASFWARTNLRRLSNCRAEIHVTPLDA
jgi:hypothetical protein